MYYGFNSDYVFEIDVKEDVEFMQMCIDKAIAEYSATTDEEKELRTVYFADNGEIIGYSFISKKYGCGSWVQGFESDYQVTLSQYYEVTGVIAGYYDNTAISQEEISALIGEEKVPITVEQDAEIWEILSKL